jgi:hypothetical protein
MFTRRRFLVTSSVAAAAGALAPALAKEVLTPSSPWDAVRREFDLDPQFVHLSLFYMTPHPRAVRTAIEEHRRRLDSNPFLTVEHGMFDFEHLDKTFPVRASRRRLPATSARTPTTSRSPRTRPRG